MVFNSRGGFGLTKVCESGVETAIGAPPSSNCQARKHASPHIATANPLVSTTPYVSTPSELLFPLLI